MAGDVSPVAMFLIRIYLDIRSYQNYTLLECDEYLKIRIFVSFLIRMFIRITFVSFLFIRIYSDIRSYRFLDTNIFEYLFVSKSTRMSHSVSYSWLHPGQGKDHDGGGSKQEMQVAFRTNSFNFLAKGQLIELKFFLKNITEHRERQSHIPNLCWNRKMSFPKTNYKSSTMHSAKPISTLFLFFLPRKSKFLGSITIYWLAGYKMQMLGAAAWQPSNFISSDRSSCTDDGLLYIQLFQILSIYAFLYCYKCHSKSLKQYQCNWCHRISWGYFGDIFVRFLGYFGTFWDTLSITQYTTKCSNLFVLPVICRIEAAKNVVQLHAVHLA